MFSHLFVRIRRCGKNGNMLFFLLSPHTPNQKKRTPSKFDKPIADKADKFDLDNIEASTSLYTMMLLMMRTLTYARTHAAQRTHNTQVQTVENVFAFIRSINCCFSFRFLRFKRMREKYLLEKFSACRMN